MRPARRRFPLSSRVERQADNNVDVLISIVAVEDVDLAIGRIRADDGLNYARNRFNSGLPVTVAATAVQAIGAAAFALLDTPINAPDESAVLRSAVVRAKRVLLCIA